MSAPKNPPTPEEIKEAFSKKTGDERILQYSNKLIGIWNDLERLSQGTKPTYEAIKTSKDIASFFNFLNKPILPAHTQHFPSKFGIGSAQNAPNANIYIPPASPSPSQKSSLPKQH